MGLSDPRGRSSDEHDAAARPTVRDDQVPEILVARDQGPIALRAMLENPLVRRSGESGLRRRLDFMTERHEKRYGERVDVLINEQAHALLGRRHVDLLRPDDPAGVLDARHDVFGSQSRVVITADGLERRSRRHEFQHLVHGNARAMNARLSEVDRRV